MASALSAPSPVTLSAASAQRRGTQLALKLLQEVQEGDTADLTIDDAYRAGRPQRNVVQTYLAKLNDCADTRTMVAFSAVLTDYLASATHFGTPSLPALASGAKAVRS